jgi:hypothetical protein
MRSADRSFFRSKAKRRATALIALVAYLVTATGVPLPVHAAKGDGQPFPCQHHACGCATAEQCWRQCCCFTPQEKLAWARKNGVIPPAHLVLEVAALAPDDHDNDNPPRGRCCARRDESPREHSMCDEDHHDHDGCTSCEHSEQSTSSGLIIGIAAMKCRGLSTLWCATGAVIPPPESITWQFRWNVVGCVAHRQELAKNFEPLPLERPPCA